MKYLIVMTLVGLSIIGCNAPKELETRTQVEISTSSGNIIVELYNETPLHRDNFINLAKNSAFDSLLFHRVIEEFMIQGGDPDSKRAKPGDRLGKGDVPYMIDAEFKPNLFHKKGALSAARDNNSKKASSGMQFTIMQGEIYNDSLLNEAERNINWVKAEDFIADKPNRNPILDSLQKSFDSMNSDKIIMHFDSLLVLAKLEKDFELYRIPEAQREVYKSIGGVPDLDQSYTVFGEVLSGMNVVDSIAASKTDENDRPIQDIRIFSTRIIKDANKH